MKAIEVIQFIYFLTFVGFLVPMFISSLLATFRFDVPIYVWISVGFNGVIFLLAGLGVFVYTERGQNDSE